MTKQKYGYILLFISLTLILVFYPVLASSKTAKELKIEYVEELLKVLQNKETPFDPQLVIASANEALRISQDISYDRGIIKSYYTLSFGYFFMGDFKQSLYNASQIENVKDLSKHSYYITLMRQMKGVVYSNMGLNSLAEEELLKGISTSKDIRREDYKHIINAQIYSALAKLYADYDDISKKDTFNNYLNKADISVRSVSPDFEYVYYPEYMILKIKKHIKENQPDSARFYTHTLLEQWDGHRYLDQPRIFTTVGDYYVFAQQPDSALYYYNYAMKRAKQSGILNHLPELYRNMSLFYLNNNQSDSAKAYYCLYVDADNELAQKKLMSSEEIVRTVLADVNKNNTSKLVKRVSAISFVVISAISLATYLVIRSRYKEMKGEFKQQASKLNEQLNSTFDDVKDLAKKNNPIFITRFQEVYPEFWNRLISLHPNLSPADLHLCAMTYLGFTTQEIADFSFLQVRSVQTRRSRLRRKIDLSPEIEFTDYLKGI